MKLTYQTGVATLVQFITLTFLGFANGVNSTVTSCRKGEDCIVDILLAIVFFIITALWFGAVWILGYFAQERRSKHLALLLIGAEGLIVLVAMVNIKGHTDILSLATSIIDTILALWIAVLAFRLMRSGGGRVVKGGRNRPRQRRPKQP